MKKLLVIAILFASSMSFAGKCVVHFNREACPGKEEASFKKCKEGKAPQFTNITNNGKECDENTTVASEKACQTLAKEACENSRTEITKLKKITASFDGAPVKTEKGDTQFCADNRPDFNKCK